MAAFLAAASSVTRPLGALPHDPHCRPTTPQDYPHAHHHPRSSSGPEADIEEILRAVNKLEKAALAPEVTAPPQCPDGCPSRQPAHSSAPRHRSVRLLSEDGVGSEMVRPIHRGGARPMAPQAEPTFLREAAARAGMVPYIDQAEPDPPWAPPSPPPFFTITPPSPPPPPPPPLPPVTREQLVKAARAGDLVLLGGIGGTGAAPNPVDEGEDEEDEEGEMHAESPSGSGDDEEWPSPPAPPSPTASPMPSASVSASPTPSPESLAESLATQIMDMAWPDLPERTVPPSNTEAREWGEAVARLEPLAARALNASVVGPPQTSPSPAPPSPSPSPAPPSPSPSPSPVPPLPVVLASQMFDEELPRIGAFTWMTPPSPSPSSSPPPPPASPSTPPPPRGKRLRRSWRGPGGYLAVLNASGATARVADPRQGRAGVPLVRGELSLVALHDPASWNADAAGISPWELQEQLTPFDAAAGEQPSPQPSPEPTPQKSAEPAPQIEYRTALLGHAGVPAPKPAPTPQPKPRQGLTPSQLAMLHGLNLGMLGTFTLFILIGFASIAKACRS